MKKYLIFDLDGTLINSNDRLKNIIFDFFKEYQPEYYDVLRYSVDFKKIPNLQEIFLLVYWKFEDEQKKLQDKLFKYLDKQNKKSLFLDWTVEKILVLKNKYKLYLSTWSSTQFANEILEKSWIKQYFEFVLWSDKIPKSEIHLDMFMEHSQDENFYINSISIWDWLCDEIFARNRNIDFIKIWQKYKSIKDIKDI